MTRNAPEPESREADPAGPPLRDPRLDTDVDDVDELDDAELEELEDDAERERQKDRSALVGLVALILVVLLAGVGFWASVSQVQDPPANPDTGQQLPARPAP